MADLYVPVVHFLESFSKERIFSRYLIYIYTFSHNAGSILLVIDVSENAIKYPLFT